MIAIAKASTSSIGEDGKNRGSGRVKVIIDGEGLGLSPEGEALLSEPEVYARLCEISAAVGVTPEEYLLRFEEVLASRPDLIISAFETALLKK